jgi:hypothetical protein
METAFRQGGEDSPSEEVEFLRKRAVSPTGKQSLFETRSSLRLMKMHDRTSLKLKAVYDTKLLNFNLYLLVRNRIK